MRPRNAMDVDLSYPRKCASDISNTSLILSDKSLRIISWLTVEFSPPSQNLRWNKTHLFGGDTVLSFIEVVSLVFIESVNNFPQIVFLEGFIYLINVGAFHRFIQIKALLIVGFWLLIWFLIGRNLEALI